MNRVIGRPFNILASNLVSFFMNFQNSLFPNTVGAVFKSGDSIVLDSFLLRVILQRGFYCSEDCITQRK